jgi:hypothetical protein
MTETDDSSPVDHAQHSDPAQNPPPEGTPGGQGQEQGQGFEPPTDDGGVFESDSKPITYLSWGAFAVLLLLALVATVRFYLSASNAISIWIAPDWVPIFQSAFNLAVVFACGVGLSILVRRMRS